MSKFKTGDKVRRINYDWHGMKVGDVGVVRAVGAVGARLFDVTGVMNADNLELVESAPADKEAELRAAYVQSVNDHEEAVITLDKLRTLVWQAEDKEAHLRALNQRARNEFIAYILQKELPQ